MAVENPVEAANPNLKEAGNGARASTPFAIGVACLRSIVSLKTLTKALSATFSPVWVERPTVRNPSGLMVMRARRPWTLPRLRV